MKEVDFSVVRAWKSGNHSPSSLLAVGQGHDTLLDAGQGSRDDVSVFKGSDAYYVLSVNRGLPYIGLSVFDLRNSDVVELSSDIYSKVKLHAHRPTGEVFSQEHEVEETFGEDWDDVSDKELVERGLEHIY